MTIDQGLKAIHVQFSDDGQHIRKWAREPFEGSTPYVSTPSPSLPSREAIEGIILAKFRLSSGEEWAKARETADAILSLLPVNGWRDGVEAAAKVAENTVSGSCDPRTAGMERAFGLKIAKRIRALSAAPGEGAGR